MCLAPTHTYSKDLPIIRIKLNYCTAMGQAIKKEIAGVYATSAHSHQSWQETKGKGNAMLRRIVLTGMLIGTLVTSLPSTTFALERGDRGDDGARHSLVQHPYNVRSVPGTLQTEIDALKTQVSQLTATVSQLTGTNTSLQTALRTALTEINALQGRVVTLEAKPSGGVLNLEKYVTINTNPINGVAGPHILITGANVHVRSGAGATDDRLSVGGSLTGLGNLIIGYNEPNTTGPVRTGSHNLVGGSFNAFSSTGGLVFGLRNTLSGPYAAIFSGEANTASGTNASVLGGNLNTAAGLRSTVYGGLNNMAANMNSISPTQETRPLGN
jgi:hypothetical protein